MVFENFALYSDVVFAPDKDSGKKKFAERKGDSFVQPLFKLGHRFVLSKHQQASANFGKVRTFQK